MGNPNPPTPPTPPTLDYATAAQHPGRARFKKWLKRLTLAILLLACLWAAPLAWLYVGWKQEQPARRMLARVEAMIIRTEPAGPLLLEPLIPTRLGWIRERITHIAPARKAPLTDDDLRTLRPLSRLKGLYLLSGSAVTDAGLVHLKGFRQLQRLHLDRTQVTDAGLAHLEGLTGLWELTLSGTRVTDAGLAHLRGLTGLRVLYLNDTRVSDAGLAHLGKLTGLQSLWLSRTAVTDGGLPHLSGLKGLRGLGLEVTRTTYEGAAEFQKTLPGCLILRGGG